ncbi:MAG TPA: hypothetical protein VMM35_04045 [Longimicrobiales bacterium]|nr:hypothetical protein [Longimicrobiales bacterium]
MAFLLVPIGCTTGARNVPTPRPIIIHSGARLHVDQERANEINAWVTAEQENIEQDPSFWVISEPAEGEPYPWDGLRISSDTVWVSTPRGAQDPQLVFQIYGHQHLMATMGRQEEWLPEAPDATGYELERAILSRAADAWMLGRAVYNTLPYVPLDELAYAKEAGFLDAFIFTARPDEFASARAEWARANPGGMEEYRDWFLETFNREPPGLRAA